MCEIATGKRLPPLIRLYLQSLWLILISLLEMENENGVKYLFILYLMIQMGEILKKIVDTNSDKDILNTEKWSTILLIYIFIHLHEFTRLTQINTD